MDATSRPAVPPALVPTALPVPGAASGAVPGTVPGPVPGSGGRPTVTAVIPTLNEADNLRWLLPRLEGVDEVVIVDGESTDGSAEVAAALRPDAVIISLPPRGKGEALRAGVAAATGEVIVILDADGGMDPAEIPSFVALVGRGFDFVTGSRYACDDDSEDLTWLRRPGNRWLARLANLLYRTQWTGLCYGNDLCYGYVALRRSAVGRLRLRSTGFEIETGMGVNAVTTGLRLASLTSRDRRCARTAASGRGGRPAKRRSAHGLEGVVHVP